MEIQSSKSSIPWLWRGVGGRRRTVAPTGGRSGGVAPGAEQFPARRGEAPPRRGWRDTVWSSMWRSNPPLSFISSPFTSSAFPPSFL
jgi:hypothetical protein